jgi:hypothetical protein
MEESDLTDESGGLYPGCFHSLVISQNEEGRKTEEEPGCGCVNLGQGKVCQSNTHLKKECNCSQDPEFYGISHSQSQI